MLKQYLPRSGERGFTILEFLVATSIGSLIIGMALTATLSNKNSYHLDLERTRVNQNMRAAMDMLALNLRQAGENLPANFPAIEVIDALSPVSGASADEVVMRRNLVDEILTVCTPVVAGTSVTSVVFGDTSLTPGCAYADQTNNFNVWQTKRLEAGGTLRAYIYNSATRAGEFFDFVSETNTGTDYRINTGGHLWANDYPVGSSAVYLIEELHFSIGQTATDADVLYVEENQDNSTYDRVVFGLDSFNIQVGFEDGTVQNQLLPTDNWTNLSFLQLSVSGSSDWKGQAINSDLRIRIFPRNILSN